MYRALIIGSAIVFVSSFGLKEARAQQINPQCAKMNDKIGCTCALESGGQVIVGEARWTRPGRGRPGPDQQFEACQKRFKR